MDFNALNKEETTVQLQKSVTQFDFKLTGSLSAEWPKAETRKLASSMVMAAGWKMEHRRWGNRKMANNQRPKHIRQRETKRNQVALTTKYK